MTSYTDTFESSPELWTEGPSFMAKIEFEEARQTVVASGWHLRQIEFETNISSRSHMLEFSHGPGEQLEVGLFPIDSYHPDKNFLQQAKKFDIELSLDGRNDSLLKDVLTELTSEDTANFLISSTEEMIQRVSANRSNTTAIKLNNEIDFCDFLCQNLPARSGNGEENIRSLSRWCRVFKLKSGTVTIYQKVKESDLKELRWPHNCIYLNRGNSYYTEKSEVGNINRALEIPILYEIYNIQNWRYEFETWENQPFRVMIQEDANSSTYYLTKAQKEISKLSDFLSTAFLSMRNLERRIKRNNLLKEESFIHIAKNYHSQIEETLKEYRFLLEHASTLLANTAQSVQALLSQEASEAADRTNFLISILSAVFFFPTTIIAFYSMSIVNEGPEESQPNLSDILLYCIAGVALSLLVLWGYTFIDKKRKLKKAKLNTERFNR